MAKGKGNISRLGTQSTGRLTRLWRAMRSQRIVAVLEEMKEISPIDHEKFDSTSEALNIDDRIEKRLAKMSNEAPMSALRSAATPEPAGT